MKWVGLAIGSGVLTVVFLAISFGYAQQEDRGVATRLAVAVEEEAPLPPFPFLERADGDRYSAQLVSLDEAWNLTVETQARQIILSINEIHCWGSFEETIQSPLVLLHQGSCIAAAVTKFDRTGLTIASRRWESTNLPWDELQAVLLQPPLNALARDRWIDRLRAPGHEQDVVYLANGDEVQCTLLGSSPLQERTEGDRIDSLAIRLSQEIVEIDLADVIAIRFRRPATGELPTEAGRAILGFRDGTQLNCAGLDVQRESVGFELVGGQTLRTRTGVSRANLWSHLTLVRPVAIKGKYLADLTPARYQAVPIWERRWEYFPNQSVVQGALRHAGRRFEEGIGMHATSSLAYVLDGKYTRFRAWVGLDESVGSAGSVVFRVYRLREGQDWEEVYRSPIRRGNDPLLAIDLDISDTYAITISVDRADDSDRLDRANWIEARVE